MSKRCRLTCDTERGIYECELDVPDAATIATVLEAGRLLVEGCPVDWDGADRWRVRPEPHDRQFVPADGDRIEIYRGLLVDPRQSRRRARRSISHRDASQRGKG